MNKANKKAFFFHSKLNFAVVVIIVVVFYGYYNCCIQLLLLILLLFSSLLSLYIGFTYRSSDIRGQSDISSDSGSTIRESDSDILLSKNRRISESDIRYQSVFCFHLALPFNGFSIICLMISDSDIRYTVSNIRSVCLDNIRYPIPEWKIAIRRPVALPFLLQ